MQFCSYGVQYDNGQSYQLITQKEWMYYFYNKYLFYPENISKRMKTGVNYWKKNNNHNISKIMEDARNNFDIDARAEFINRDNFNQCFHVYSFCSNRKNADKAYRFYDIHRDKLLKFIAYFTQKVAHLIEESNKPENLIMIPGYNTADINDPTRDYTTELLEENQDTQLSSREFETMLLYAYGLTGKQLAEVFSQSVRTIESQLIKIRQKTKCKDRKELQLYVRRNGWSGLERFFFNYEGVPDDLPANQTRH